MLGEIFSGLLEGAFEFCIEVLLEPLGDAVLEALGEAWQRWRRRG